MKIRYKPRMRVRYTIRKNLAHTKEFRELAKKIEEARKDPEFIKFIKNFIAYHTGKTP